MHAAHTVASKKVSEESEEKKRGLFCWDDYTKKVEPDFCIVFCTLHGILYCTFSTDWNLFVVKGNSTMTSV